MVERLRLRTQLLGHPGVIPCEPSDQRLVGCHKVGPQLGRQPQVGTVVDRHVVRLGSLDGELGDVLLGPVEREPVVLNRCGRVLELRGGEDAGVPQGVERLVDNQRGRGELEFAVDVPVPEEQGLVGVRLPEEPLDEDASVDY